LAVSGAASQKAGKGGGESKKRTKTLHVARTGRDLFLIGTSEEEQLYPSFKKLRTDGGGINPPRAPY